MKRKILIFAALMATVVVAAGAYIVVSRRSDDKPDAAARQKVYLIGFDGASWNLMAGPLREGKMPNFEKVIKGGTHGPLKSFIPTRSPILWTSIATGKAQKKHGIGDFVAEKDGKMIPVSGTQRITKAFWNILSEYGVRVGVVNWWVTWPPEEVNGFMVSDRYRNGNPKKLGGNVTYPLELINELPRVGLPRNRYLEERKKYGLPDERPAEAVSKNIETLVAGYKTYWGQDKAVWDSSKYLLEKKDVDVFAVVFRIVDVSSHLFWTYLDLDLIAEMRAKMANGTLTEDDVHRMDREYGKFIDPIYAYADKILGDFLKHTDENTNIIICSDHGFKWEEGRYGHANMDTPPDGVLILYGPAFRDDYELQGATLLDITPTLLYLEKIPVGRDMDGKILFEAFEPSFVKSHQPTMVASHDKGMKPQEGQPLSTEQDPEILEDLRTLGYIQ